MKPVKFVLTSAVVFLLLSLPFLLRYHPEPKPILPPMILEDGEPAQETYNVIVARAQAQSSSISGLANVSTLQSNYLFVIAIPGVANRNIAWGQLTNLIAAMFPTNVGGVTYITNLNVMTNINNYSIITNLTVAQTITVSGKATLQIVNTLSTSATNGFFVFTNIWSGGPTGTVDLSLSDQGRASITACSITGVINKSNTVVESVVLSLTNTAATNWLLTLAGGIMLPQRTNQVVVSNGYPATLSIRYHPAFGTQAVFVQF